MKTRDKRRIEDLARAKFKAEQELSRARAMVERAREELDRARAEWDAAFTAGASGRGAKPVATIAAVRQPEAARQLLPFGTPGENPTEPIVVATERFLRAHPDKEFGHTEVAAAIRRKAESVRAALFDLKRTGRARKVGWGKWSAPTTEPKDEKREAE